ncbi:MAG: hypothetical protein KC800_06465 [Candidatus Eremiobacteraeota bacterium]|nr:hypothetical protein [Candidatus Eremiobacteraeota bacterium]
MKVWISDSSSEVVTCLSLNCCDDGEMEIVCLEGELPDGLTVQDLTSLGIVTYETGLRGRPVPKVCPIEPSENLEYVRALIEAMPPGYFISKVESAKIDELRKEKAEKFQAELEKLQTDDTSDK